MLSVNRSRRTLEYSAIVFFATTFVNLREGEILLFAACVQPRHDLLLLLGRTGTLEFYIRSLGRNGSRVDLFSRLS